MKEFCLRPLTWQNVRSRDNGSVVASSSCDEIYVKGQYDLYLQYDVFYSSPLEGNGVWKVMIQFPRETIEEETDTLQKGKRICERRRKRFWTAFFRATDRLLEQNK